MSTIIIIIIIQAPEAETLSQKHTKLPITNTDSHHRKAYITICPYVFIKMEEKSVQILILKKNCLPRQEIFFPLAKEKTQIPNYEDWRRKKNNYPC